MTQIEQLISKIEEKKYNYKAMLKSAEPNSEDFYCCRARVALCEELLIAARAILKEPASEDSQDSELPDGWKEKGIALFTQIRVIPTILSTKQGHSQYVIQADANDEEVLLACPDFPNSVISKVKIVPCE